MTEATIQELPSSVATSNSATASVRRTYWAIRHKDEKFPCAMFLQQSWAKDAWRGCVSPKVFVLEQIEVEVFPITI